MCDQSSLENGGTLESVLDCYKNQEMRNKAVNRCFFVFNSIPVQYKTEEKCDRVVFEDLFSMRYVPDQYKTQ